MSIEKNVQIVKNFLAALGRRDKQGLLALSAEDIQWIIPGEDWPLAGTHRGHAGLENLLQKANETVETPFTEPPEFIAQGGLVNLPCHSIVIVEIARDDSDPRLRDSNLHHVAGFEQKGNPAHDLGMVRSRSVHGKLKVP